MKYKDPTTGDFKEIRIRATDELPIGSEIDVDDNTDIPAGWEEITPRFENGLIKSSDFSSSSNVGGSAGKIYNLTFTNSYTNKPTVLVSFTHSQTVNYYGAFTVGIANLTKTGCTIYHNATGLSDANAFIAYMVISND